VNDDQLDPRSDVPERHPRRARADGGRFGTDCIPARQRETRDADELPEHESATIDAWQLAAVIRVRTADVYSESS